MFVSASGLGGMATVPYRWFTPPALDLSASGLGRLFGTSTGLAVLLARFGLRATNKVGTCLGRRPAHTLPVV